MVVEKTSGESPGNSKRISSPVRSSTRIRAARFQPTARETLVVTKPSPQRNLNQTWSTIYKLNMPDQTHIQNAIGTTHSRPCQPHLLQRLKNSEHRDGTRSNMVASLTRHNIGLLQRNEKSVLDKVEDMDVDNQSDQEGVNLGEANVAGSSSSSTLSTSDIISEKSVKNKGYKKVMVGQKEPKKNSTNNKLSQPAVKMTTYENAAKKKPVYIILHASTLRISQLEGRALKPVRIQAGKILIEMELQSNNKQEIPSETLSLRIPCTELFSIKVNLSEPPFIFVAVIKENYSKALIESSKNGLRNKLKGIEKLHVIVHLTYDNIPKDVNTDFNSFRSELERDVRWEEMSSTKARHILSGEDSCTDDTNVSLVEDKKKVVKENRKRQINHKTENNKSDTNKQNAVKIEKGENDIDQSKESQKPSSPVAKRRRTISNDEDIPKSSESQNEEQPSASEEKAASENKDTIPKIHHSEVISADQADKSTKPNSPYTRERSFEENRLDARQIHELESLIAEKERMLSQQRQIVELRDLQLEQERESVRTLRASLRDEQRTKRDLEQQYQAVNNELLVRNTREAIAESRMSELESELSELNVSLNSTRNENERLVQDIHQARNRSTESGESLRSERERVTTLQQEIESYRATLQSLRDELRENESALAQERELRTAATERNTELERELTATRNEYEERIARSTGEHHRTLREHEECSRLLVSTREQLQDANRALHRAQETVDEYSRMQPRDWTISRDEIVITEKVLGQGAWGWVKEGKFRGTMVAVKQMHELIVSPHNRRLFEREMQIASRCRHPNLLQFIGATNDNGLALLVTELLETDMRTVLGQRSLCNDEVVTIATDVSRALNYLHLNKPFPIIHRDISSTNVLLWRREDSYHAKLSDYGAANFMRQCMTVSPGACIYAAPEAVTSRQSTKVDVYSFGLLLCEMCIRELPVPGHTHEQIRLITNAHLRELVQRNTNESPESRPTMAEVLAVLLRLSRNSPLGIVSINNRHAVV